MEISATAIFLVHNILANKVTYSEVIKKKPELQEQIDDYIKQNNLIVDNTV